MATASAGGENASDAECSICADLFIEPKLLPCSHTLCRPCLLNWLSAASPLQPPSCPLCKRAVAEPAVTRTRSSGSSNSDRTKYLEELVDSLPKDLAMSALADSTRLLSKQHACVVCVNNAAVSVCLDCEGQDLLCSQCTNVHSRMSATRKHRVEDLASTTPERLASSHRASCCGDMHVDNKPAEFFCPSHSSALCSSCVSYKHRACPNVTLFEHRVEELRKEVADMTKTLRSTEAAFVDVIRKLDNKLKELEDESQPALAEIDALFDRLEEEVKKCRRRVKQRALDRTAKAKGKIESAKADFAARKGSLTTHRVSVERVEKAMPAKFLNDINPTLKARIEQLDLTVQIPAEVERVSVPPLEVDLTALERIETELKRFDLIRDTQQSASPSTVDQRPQASVSALGSAQDVRQSRGSSANTARGAGRPGVAALDLPQRNQQSLAAVDLAYLDPLSPASNPAPAESTQPLSAYDLAGWDPFSMSSNPTDTGSAQPLSAYDLAGWDPIPSNPARTESAQPSPARGPADRVHFVTASDSARAESTQPYDLADRGQGLNAPDSTRWSQSSPSNSAPLLFQPSSASAPASAQEQPRLWRFHDKTGQNITLSRDRRTARLRGSKSGHGIVVSSEPMKVNMVYEIRVTTMKNPLMVELDQKKSGLPEVLPCGAMLQSPENEILPPSALRGWPCAVVFSGGYVYNRGQKEWLDSSLSGSESYFQRGNLFDLYGVFLRGGAKNYKEPLMELKHLQQSSRIGLMLDSQKRLNLLINRILVIKVPHVKSPCFAFFELYSNNRQVSASPLFDSTERFVCDLRERNY